MTTWLTPSPKPTPCIPRTVLIGGRRRGAEEYFDRINARVKRLEDALKPKQKRELLPNEENQQMLPGIER
ncbi:MAG: hypothetical protein OCC45_08245 [Desulfotalea sp.]